MKFRIGINYWPARKAMHWWHRFEPGEVRHDFALIADAGFDSVRIFLLWEDFQPLPDDVAEPAIRNLLQVADIAADNRLSLIVTLFTGHMSGANWLPCWAVEDDGTGRFPIICGGRPVRAAPRNWYVNKDIQEAQILLAQTIARALRGHPGVWAYDLGNENSNCVVPPSRDSAIVWLKLIADALKSEDSSRPLTLGLHAEDLEEDRRLGPREAAAVCDFLSMHGYPMYLKWAEAPDDERVLPFLGHLTSWLGNGLDVLVEEFGAPSVKKPDQDSKVPVLDYRKAAHFTQRALRVLHRSGFLGAMLWCFADYHEFLWHEPPLDALPHERHFGLWSSGHSVKPSLAEISRFAESSRQQRPSRFDWIDIPARDFYSDPQGNLHRLYRNYRKWYTRSAIR